jgi:hypothetical protein
MTENLKICSITESSILKKWRSIMKNIKELLDEKKITEVEQAVYNLLLVPAYLRKSS